MADPILVIVWFLVKFNYFCGQIAFDTDTDQAVKFSFSISTEPA
jgi:hypothetical protein